MRNIAGFLFAMALAALPVGAADAQAEAVKTLDTPRSFPVIATKAQWQERRQAIREQILVSAGLWPMPEKTPLHAKIFGKIERDGYSVERVYFQSYPGFYVAGNLYRPLGRGPGPFPAILNPHGHWAHGRLEDTDLGSIPGRCINFAKQGMIAFSYDMVGFNDTHFPESPATMPFDKRHRTFDNNGPAALLWSLTLMGLQTWDSIRALDFLESLPDADKTRLACTGASGGGTQTFILGAIDDRLAAQAPVVMVSHTMQGGCLCENMPGLRVEFSNMEIAAAAAPRPQILVSDTRDWTKTTMEMEGPAIEHIYELFRAPKNLRYVRYDFEHNYNKTSREAVYQWFDKFLLNQPDQPTPEIPFQKEPDEDLVVFPDGKLPDDAITQKDLVQELIQMHRDQLQRLSPANKASLERYKRVMYPAWKRTLQLKWTDEEPHFANFTPPESKERNGMVVVLAHEDGKAHFIDKEGKPIGLARLFLDKGFNVVIPTDQGAAANPDQTSVFFTTYNRTRLQERVGNLVSVCRNLWRMYDVKHSHFVLCGCGRAGLWALLAAPAADAVIADCGQGDVSSDQALLSPDLFCPGLRNIDTFEGAAILALPNHLTLFNAAKDFPVSELNASYKISHAAARLKVLNKPLNDQEIVAAVLDMGF